MTAAMLQYNAEWYFKTGSGENNRYLEFNMNQVEIKLAMPYKILTFKSGIDFYQLDALLSQSPPSYRQESIPRRHWFLTCNRFREIDAWGLLKG
jgi:hypothetical protein